MIVNHLMVRVPVAMAVDRVPKLLAMVVHWDLFHCQKDQTGRILKVMKLVGSVAQVEYISSTDRVRLTSRYWTLRPL